MTKHIFRVPVDTVHFNATIKAGKAYSDLLPFLTFIEQAHLETLAHDGMLRYWGSLPRVNNQKTFMRISGGDELLCYRSGKYVALATIAFSTRNPALARYSWGETKDGTTWELVYFFRDVTLMSIDMGVINSAFGFKNAPVVGFSALSEQSASQFIATYESVTDFIKNLPVADNNQDARKRVA
jgi:hypothetical protein